MGDRNAALLMYGIAVKKFEIILAECYNICGFKNQLLLVYHFDGGVMNINFFKDDKLNDVSVWIAIIVPIIMIICTIIAGIQKSPLFNTLANTTMIVTWVLPILDLVYLSKKDKLYPGYFFAVILGCLPAYVNMREKNTTNNKLPLYLSFIPFSIAVGLNILRLLLDSTDIGTLIVTEFVILLFIPLCIGIGSENGEEKLSYSISLLANVVILSVTCVMYMLFFR